MTSRELEINLVNHPKLETQIDPRYSTLSFSFSSCATETKIDAKGNNDNNNDNKAKDGNKNNKSAVCENSHDDISGREESGGREEGRSVGERQSGDGGEIEMDEGNGGRKEGDAEERGREVEKERDKGNDGAGKKMTKPGNQKIGLVAPFVDAQSRNHLAGKLQCVCYF